MNGLKLSDTVTKSAFAAASIFLAFLHAPALAAHSASSVQNELGKAIAAYHAGKFKDVLVHAQQYRDRGGSDAGQALYFEANALVKLGKIMESRSKYDLARALCKTALLRNYSNEAVEAIAEGVKRRRKLGLTGDEMPPDWALPDEVTSADGDAGTKRADTKLADTKLAATKLAATKLADTKLARTSESTAAEQTSDEKINKALARVQDQAEKNAHGFRTSVQQTMTPDKKLIALLDETNAKIQELVRSRDLKIAQLRAKHNSSKKGYDPSDDIKTINADSDRELYPLRKLATKLTDESRYQETLKQLKEDIKSTIDSRKTGLFTPKLLLVGSDLYTRNYQVVRRAPEPLPDELLATQERMVLDARTTPGKYISKIMPVLQPKIDAKADLKVHGQVVR